MAIGMPIIGLATAELATVIHNGENGCVHTDIKMLVDAMVGLQRDPAEARSLGDGARRTALERFHIDRFVQDWHDALLQVTACRRVT
jgi:glycosyltransferase involved in cell wall biosynthesis